MNDRDAKLRELIRREEDRLLAIERRKHAKRAESLGRLSKKRISVWCETDKRLFPTLHQAVEALGVDKRHLWRAVMTKGGRTVKGKLVCRAGDVPIPDLK
jgi:transposase